ncbi:hypothetical protein BJY59DRAFT_319557 [Rhodotorula toruloides]
MSPGTSRPAKTSSYPKVSRGFVPPHLASRLSRFAFTDDPQYAERTPPEFSLACEQIFRLMPDDFWVTKRSEMNKLKEERNVIRSRLREGKGVRSELLKVSEDMRQRLGELAMGYVVLDYARYNFAIYLHERGVVSEYWWQALEEFAEGAAGGLSLYWPASARRECTEGAMVRADWVVQRFANECADHGQLPPPHLAFLHSLLQVLLQSRPYPSLPFRLVVRPLRSRPHRHATHRPRTALPSSSPTLPHLCPIRLAQDTRLSLTTVTLLSLSTPSTLSTSTASVQNRRNRISFGLSRLHRTFGRSAKVPAVSCTLHRPDALSRCDIQRLHIVKPTRPLQAAESGCCSSLSLR